MAVKLLATAGLLGQLLTTVVASVVQSPLLSTHLDQDTAEPVRAERNLHGRFLHLTGTLSYPKVISSTAYSEPDFHPDPFYKLYSDPDNACHRKHGVAGVYGAETTACDSPYSLVNATFQWINDNLKDEIDFVIWTGDSARHDNDENIPRSAAGVLGSNKMMVDKMHEVFGQKGSKSFAVPIIPTIGNNDILPHNIFVKGPNTWTNKYLQIWKHIVPEEQRHQFDRGGWFFVEVIPQKLAVFSLNTMFFYQKNAAVDGCAAKSEPGFEQMEWLRIQLQFFRNRGMKAIITGHVPPARNEEKVQWDETCWQKYTLWTRQYRDIIVGSFWGHMNVEHFFFHDFKDIDYNIASGEELAEDRVDIEEVKPGSYLPALRKQWSKFPSKPKGNKALGKKGQAAKRDYYDKVGGKWAERFALSFVAASVVPNYFPALRVIEYNTTGLGSVGTREDDAINSLPADVDNSDLEATKKKKKKKKKGKKKKPKFTVPDGPSKAAPPGPAYSPQTLSLIGYVQYFANLTHINNDYADAGIDGEQGNDRTPHPRKFEYEVSYDTRNHQDPYRISEGLQVSNMLELAARIGKYKPSKDDRMDVEEDIQSLDENDGGENTLEEIDVTKKKHKKKKHKKRRIINKTWYAFVDRAIVGIMSPDELHKEFGQVVGDDRDD